MRKQLLLFAFLLFTIGASAQIVTTTINFDTTGNWTAGSGGLTSYQTDHTYTNGLFSASTSMDALRQSTATQDGFAGANGTYGWRLRNSGTGAWTANIASGGVAAFSIGIRRWDASPEPNYTLDYSVDGGTTWTNVATINNTTLSNSSAYTVFNGTINDASSNIKIRVNRIGGERIMIDDFVWTNLITHFPVTKKSFTVRKQASSNLIAWTTLTELNNKHFNVQRSPDGQVFETIGTINSLSTNGNSAKELNYSYEDENPMVGHNYFRLEQVDVDDKKSYSDVIDIIWGADGSEVSIYPNPATQVLNIDLTASQASQTEVKLVDLSGRVLQSISKKTNKGLHHFTLDFGTIATGVYGVQIFENNILTKVSKIRKN